LSVEHRKRRAAGGRRRASNVLAILTVLVLAGAGLLSFRLWTVLHAINPQTQPQDLLSLVQARSEEPGSLGWKIKHDERINILLLGYGGPGHDGPYLTDSMMMLSIRPGSREAIMISLPRDLWVKIPALPNQGFMWGKLNSAYEIGQDRRSFPKVRPEWKTATGGGDLASATVAQITGQQVDYWVGVDFKAFSDVVNALGGIRIDVPQTLDDPFFPLGETNSYTRIHFNAGLQQMDGERALQYARSRETTSDFDRSRRQQLIMLGVRQRAFSIRAVPKLFSLLTALQDNVRTNLRPAEMHALADLAGQVKDVDIHRVSVDNTNLLRESMTGNGQYILLPRDQTYATFQHYMAMVLPNHLPLKARVPFQVQDASKRYWLPPGLTPAAVATDLLQGVGWNASVGPPLAQRLAQTEIRDGSGGTAAATVAWLAEFFKAPVVTVPAGANDPLVSVVLGSDFTLKAFPAPGR
jgi:LCP family protein required for cell wall assembly